MHSTRYIKGRRPTSHAPSFTATTRAGSHFMKISLPSTASRAPPRHKRVVPSECGDYGHLDRAAVSVGIGTRWNSDSEPRTRRRQGMERQLDALAGVAGSARGDAHPGSP